MGLVGLVCGVPYKKKQLQGVEGSVDFRLGNPPIRVLHMPRVIQ